MKVILQSQSNYVDLNSTDKSSLRKSLVKIPANASIKVKVDPVMDSNDSEKVSGYQAVMVDMKTRGTYNLGPVQPKAMDAIHWLAKNFKYND